MTGEDKSQTNDDWCTPERVIRLLLQFWNGPPRLDPCSNPQSNVPADRKWYGPPGVDGLLASWSSLGSAKQRPRRDSMAGRVTVFFNPPFSNKYEWTRKASFEAGFGCEVIGLVPADTDTEWFDRYVVRAARAACFLKGRLRFEGDRTFPARFPCVMPYWGPRPGRFAWLFREAGWIWRASREQATPPTSP